MIEQAKSIGANGVLNVRYSTSSITAGAAEIYVYGTAVVLDMNTDEFSQRPLHESMAREKIA